MRCYVGTKKGPGWEWGGGRKDEEEPRKTWAGDRECRERGANDFFSVDCGGFRSAPLRGGCTCTCTA
jgi:hypothetical protein